MPKTKFPNIIHVTREQDGDDSYLVAHENGVHSIDENETPIAIYRRVGRGRVNIVKTYKETQRG